jgi:hypothetical protein
MKMETVEHFAQIALVSHLLGHQQPLGGAELEKLLVARSKYQGTKSAAPLPVSIPAADDGHEQRRGTIPEAEGMQAVKPRRVTRHS